MNYFNYLNSYQVYRKEVGRQIDPKGASLIYIYIYNIHIIYIYIYIYGYMVLGLCVYVYIHPCIHACTHACIRSYTYNHANTTHTHTNRHTQTHTHTHGDRQTETDRQAGRQAGRQADRQTDRNCRVVSSGFVLLIIRWYSSWAVLADTPYVRAPQRHQSCSHMRVVTVDSVARTVPRQKDLNLELFVRDS